MFLARSFFNLTMRSCFFLPHCPQDPHVLSSPLPFSLLISWMWPWRRRWQVSGWRSPVWRRWAVVTIRMHVIFWTSWSLRVRTVLNRCTPTGCPATAPSKLARTLCLSRTSTCPTWICPPGWLTVTTVWRASWAARTKSWAASKSLSPFTPTKATPQPVRSFQVFLDLHIKMIENWETMTSDDDEKIKMEKTVGSIVVIF